MLSVIARPVIVIFFHQVQDTRIVFSRGRRANNRLLSQARVAQQHHSCLFPLLFHRVRLEHLCVLLDCVFCSLILSALSFSLQRSSEPVAQPLLIHIHASIDVCISVCVRANGGASRVFLLLSPHRSSQAGVSLSPCGTASRMFPSISLIVSSPSSCVYVLMHVCVLYVSVGFFLSLPPLFSLQC